MGAEGAAEIVFRKEIDEGNRRGRGSKEARKRKELIDRIPRDVRHPCTWRRARLVDDIIEPAETRA
jgi:methylmalonyl-CoA carboxyltransferase 12S subunit